ncbi:MAG TPA: methyltransferase domain-containing protein [Candidatus Binatia bacterium]
MERNDTKRWNIKHGAEAGPGEPAAFLRQLIESGSWSIPQGRAFDVAAGTGRNALYLAARGFDVDAVDLSETGLATGHTAAVNRGLTVNFIQLDLANAVFPQAAYDLIVNFNFLDRSLVPKLKGALKGGGRVIFETFLIDQRSLGHPNNPAYLLGHNELLELFREFRVLYYREGKFRDGETDSFRAGLLAEKPSALPIGT